MDTLPNELLAKIFEELNVIDIYSVEQVNKQFFDISNATFNKNFEKSLVEILSKPSTKKYDDSPFELLDKIQARIRTRIKFIQLKHQIFTLQKLNFKNSTSKYSEILNQLNISLRDNLSELNNYHKMVTKNGAFFENIMELNISSFPFLVDQSLFPSDYQLENFKFIEKEGEDPKCETKKKKTNKNKRKRRDEDDNDDEDDIEIGHKKKKKKTEKSDNEDSDNDNDNESDKEEEDVEKEDDKMKRKIETSKEEKSDIKEERNIKIRITYNYSLADSYDKRKHKIDNTESALYLLFHSNSKKLLNYLRSPFESFLLPVDNAEEKRNLFLLDQNDDLPLAIEEDDDENEDDNDGDDEGDEEDEGDDEKDEEEEKEEERDRIEDDCDDGDYLLLKNEKIAKLFKKHPEKKAEFKFPNFGNEKQELKYAKKAVRKLKGTRGTVCQVEHEEVHNVIHLNPHLGRKLLFLILFQNFPKENEEDINQLIELKNFIRKIPIQFVFMILLNNSMYNEISRELQIARADTTDKYISSPINDIILAFKQKTEISNGDFEFDSFHENDCNMRCGLDSLKEKIQSHFPFLYGENFISLSVIAKLNQLCDIIDVFRSKNSLSRLDAFIWDHCYQYFRLYNTINPIDNEIIDQLREEKKQFFHFVDNPFFKKEFFQSFSKGGGEFNVLFFMAGVSHSNLNSSFDLLIPSIDQMINENREKIHFNLKNSSFEMERTLNRSHGQFYWYSLSVSFENETNWKEFRNDFSDQENEPWVDEQNKTFYLIEPPKEEVTQFLNSLDTLFTSENEKTYPLKMDKWKQNFTILFDFLIKRYSCIYSKEDLEKYLAVSPIMKSFYLAQFIEIVSTAFSCHFCFSIGE